MSMTKYVRADDFLAVEKLRQALSDDRVLADRSFWASGRFIRRLPFEVVVLTFSNTARLRRVL